MKHHIQEVFRRSSLRFEVPDFSHEARWKARRSHAAVGMEVFPDTLWQRVAEFAPDRTLASLEIALREPDLSLAWKARDVSSVAMPTPKERAVAAARAAFLGGRRSAKLRKGELALVGEDLR